MFGLVSQCRSHFQKWHLKSSRDGAIDESDELDKSEGGSGEKGEWDDARPKKQYRASNGYRRPSQPHKDAVSTDSRTAAAAAAIASLSAFGDSSTWNALSNISTTLAAQQETEPGPQPASTTVPSASEELQSGQPTHETGNQEHAALPSSLAAFESTEEAAAAGFATGLAAGMAAGIAAWEAAIAEANARQRQFAVQNHHSHVYSPSTGLPEPCHEASPSMYEYQTPHVGYPVEASMPSSSFREHPNTPDLSKLNGSSALQPEMTIARCLQSS